MAEKAGAAMKSASTTGLTHSRVFEQQLTIVTGEIRRKAIWAIWGKVNREKVLAAMRERLGLDPGADITLKDGRWDAVLENAIKKELWEALSDKERADFQSKHRVNLLSRIPDL